MKKNKLKTFWLDSGTKFRYKSIYVKDLEEYLKKVFLKFDSSEKLDENDKYFREGWKNAILELLSDLEENKQ
jgi:hypothetical protein